ncbi:MAG TPA: ABC transporter ATP-binding protein [Candidatus Atribacteria bacterium]|nr:ABC transporter ATP-binding protein [Candidatus Atribacteria bacterium]
MKTIVLDAKNLTKLYNHTKVVDSINLQIEEGEIFGFLGPNGAGKTTTILMALGLTEPTSGEINVFGYNSTREPLKVKKITSYLPENVGYYEDLTAQENLKYITRLNGIPGKKADAKIEEVLKNVGLQDVAQVEVGKYSKGMKQRLGMAAVLVKEPKLAILDEPTTGIDPKGVEEILELIVKMSREQNITVLLSSHLLYQVQKICTKIGIISQGRIVAQGTIEEIGKSLLKEEKEDLLEVKVANKLTPALEESIKQIEGVMGVEKKSPDHSLEEIYIKYFREG